jgi:hypothetical protein
LCVCMCVCVCVCVYFSLHALLLRFINMFEWGYKFFLIYIFIYFGNTGVWTLDFTFARQALYYLSQSASPVFPFDYPRILQYKCKFIWTFYGLAYLNCFQAFSVANSVALCIFNICSCHLFVIVSLGNLRRSENTILYRACGSSSLLFFNF